MVMHHIRLVSVVDVHLLSHTGFRSGIQIHLHIYARHQLRHPQTDIFDEELPIGGTSGLETVVGGWLAGKLKGVFPFKERSGNVLVTTKDL